MGLRNERSFSFPYQFADASYDLNNPELLETDQQMNVIFETQRADFPPNVTDLQIDQVSLFFACKDGFTGTITIGHLFFTVKGCASHDGGAASMTGGLISTRQTNGSSWGSMKNKQPIGEWELKLPNTDDVKTGLKDDLNEDVLCVSGTSALMTHI